MQTQTCLDQAYGFSITFVVNIFKAIGDRFGGFQGINEDTRYRKHLIWARICVRIPNDIPPTSLEFFVDDLLFTIPVWVESSPGVDEADRNLVKSCRKIPQKSNSPGSEQLMTSCFPSEGSTSHQVGLRMTFTC